MGGRPQSPAGPLGARRLRRVSPAPSPPGTVVAMGSTPRRSTVPDRPLVVTSDPGLLDEMLRLCAAAGVEASVAHDVAAARLSWVHPPLVVVGADIAAALAGGRLPPRPDVVVVDVSGSGAGDEAWESATALGAPLVAVPAGQSWLVDRLGSATGATSGAGCTVAVVAARGGGGATVLSVALATEAARSGLECLLVDGDPMGAGIDLVLGAEHAEGLRWPDLVGAGGRMDGAALLEALPQVDGLAVLSTSPLSTSPADGVPVPADAMRSVLAAAARCCDLVVVDLPRHLDGAAQQAVAAATVTLLVVPAEVRAVAAASRVATAVTGLCADVRLVVRGPAPSGLSPEEVATALALPAAAWLPPEPGLDARLDRGAAPGRAVRSPLARVCRQLLGDLPVRARRAA